MPKVSASNIEPGTHWVDSTRADTIVVIQQPEGQRCAVVGGIMALRMHKLGAKGVIVSGRVRDMEELQSLEGLPVRITFKYCTEVLADQFRYGPVLYQQLALLPRL